MRDNTTSSGENNLSDSGTAESSDSGEDTAVDGNDDCRSGGENSREEFSNKLVANQCFTRNVRGHRDLMGGGGGRIRNHQQREDQTALIPAYISLTE